ncbi:MAG: orotidine-5'-phosphate decarboxylase [Chloroflexota bacterium]|nr:orotidine-5'-phosphate decarboxylase [Chloroflexota bacterium]
MPCFVDALDETARRNRSLLCVGLDPWRPSLPVESIAAFTGAIIEATADLVCAFKLNIAFFEAEGFDGLRALEQTIAAAKSRGVPVVLDAKRGDIPPSARAYAKAVFEAWDADAVTVSPWMGGDSLEPFLAYEERGVFVLARTSNPGGDDLQAPEVGGEPMYERVARLASEWNTRGNVGLVVGATRPRELARLRELCPAMPILVPGLGVQQGDLEASVEAGVDADGMRALFNASRSVIYASGGADYAQAARAAATATRDAINAVAAPPSAGGG